jgi:hypothetical protein
LIHHEAKFFGDAPILSKGEKLPIQVAIVTLKDNQASST